MSEEIDLDANHLSTSEDAFEKFQSVAMFEEDDYITLADIAPPQPSVPNLSEELNEIPYDNEVVLGSPQNDETGQVNNHNDTGSRLLDISESNVFSEHKLDTSGETYQNNDSLRVLAYENSSTEHEIQQNIYERQDLSSDGLGAQNYVIEDSAIIQDSLLSTTADQNDVPYETLSDVAVSSKSPRRTRRGRIPNTAKYPITSASTSNTAVKRGPGRPKKAPLAPTTLEPDSTNLETSVSENGSVTDGSIIDVVTPVGRRKRGRPKQVPIAEVITPTPIKRGRKPKKTMTPPSNEELISSNNDNTLLDSTNTDVGNQKEVDSSQPVDICITSRSTKTKRGVKKGKKALQPTCEVLENTDPYNNDDADDICLSKLKNELKENETNSNDAEATPTDNIQNDGEAKPDDDKILDTVKTTDTTNTEENESTPLKRNSKMPINSDFEYNIDKVVKEATAETQPNESGEGECLLVEDTSKRRRTAKKTFVYDEGSDEDPFANLESSDDEPKRRKKGHRYNSDDEYVPRTESSKGRGKIRSSSSESEEELDDLGTKKHKTGVSPFKKGRKRLDNKSLVSTIKPKADDDDIEGCLETTMIKIDESMKPPAEAWATSNEFENFITQKIQGTSLKIKKVSSKEITDTLVPLDIPVVDQNGPKKTVEISTQTKNASTSTVSVQTSAPYDIPMKTNMELTTAQSEKACEFLSSVVKTTVELGQLMSQKSEDFMKKKINMENVTDTIKMDYCVRKSFLLFKLAKHNLLQMEEDLANQYDAFLKEHNLSKCRDIPKKITPKPKTDSDSDCEIVEVVGFSDSKKTKQEKPKINPKTVFLNKELSIKIAKKPSAPEKPVPGKKKLEIKGRHAVWINKNVMVKKVAPTQSFLAQDSRNKKPPDTLITEKMVSDFFEGYNRKRALLTCKSLINTDWLTCVQTEYACHYFVHELDAANTVQNDLTLVANENNEETEEICNNINKINNTENPKTLFSLCTKVILKCLQVKNNQTNTTQKLTCHVADGTDTKGPVALFRLCIDALKIDQYILDDKTVQKENSSKVKSHFNNLNDQSNIESMEDVGEEINNWSGQYNSQDEDSQSNITFEYNGQAIDESEDSLRPTVVLPLASLCFKEIVKNLNQETIQKCIPEDVSEYNNSYEISYSTEEEDTMFQSDEEDISLTPNDNNSFRIGTKSLFSLCVELIQSKQGFTKTPIQTYSKSYLSCELKALKTLAFESIKHMLYPSAVEEIFESTNYTETNENFTIDCVNTLTEEAFESLQVPQKIRIRKLSQNSSNYSDEFDNNDYGDNDEMDFNTEHETDDNGWASQLQMQEFRSCFMPHVNATEESENNETIQSENHETLHEPSIDANQATPQIKTEPVDDFTEENIVDPTIVKTEPLPALSSLNEMTHIPDSIVTKKELMMEATNDVDGSALITEQGSSSYNGESFEQFVKLNKMIRSMDASDDENEIFSQSGLRIRRQHEPDLYPEHDMNMGLLVPHTFEPLQLVEAKGSLMESSSDDDGNSKKTGKKKDKRKKKTKKDAKITSSKESPVVSKITPVVKEKPVPDNEVAILTRRMREKLRQEEKKIESSDSDSEQFYLLSTNKDKTKKDKPGQDPENKDSGSDSDTLYMMSKVKNHTKSKDSKAEHSKENVGKDEQVQCSNVDSTEKLIGPSKNKINEKDQFSGFTAIDQNEISNYQKLMQFVYDKIIPSDDIGKDNEIEKDTETGKPEDSEPIIHPDEPVELLECEPTMPMFDESMERPGPKKIKNKTKKSLETGKVTPKYTERHGWHCYSVDPNDTKLYKDAQILLEKLPESFVETYMEYQDIMNKDLDDQEVDRLINLQTLNRSISAKDIKDGKKIRSKGSSKEASVSGQNTRSNSRSPSPSYSDNLDELAPSEDEGPNLEDEMPPLMPVRSSENNLAKNLLMDDHDSDSDGAGGKKIKEEPKDPADQVVKTRKPGPKSQMQNKVNVGPESLMLTADKMMNKELNLLHAPIVLQDGVDVKDVKKETSPKEESKSSKKSSTRHTRERVKNDDDSSSEEEKQWVSTKEKLLKRMGKKEDAVADDAKRAKLVNEFIERRNESDRKNKRESHQGRKGRARRKRLERQKQLRFLSNELYDEGIDGITTGKRGAAAGLFKGRRNIRKVIDKKSLARSTVVANMEEFERKRRLNMRQSKLREVLGCEEGVNVLVINDEVCLEYDFVEQRPVVTVHQFFTKVMKAHQYEGVKFMWDACFESLGTIEAGHPGGGCILAHCMGLGKTLQVLALLHTVLTHPRAHMQRVLVCCPLSTVLNWVDEIHKWIGPVTHEIKVFELSKLRKTYERAYQLEDWYNGGGIFIIGYELFRSLTTLDPEIDEIRPTIINKIRTALLDPGPDIIVCDEGHLLKNDCSVLAVAMSRVVTKRRIVLTGTPMQNNLREYFCMVNFIKPNLLGTYSEYSNRFENPIMNGQHRDSREEDIKLMKARTHILHKVLEGCLQRQEASVLYPYLPKKHEYTVFIPLTQCQWDLYNHYMDNYARTQKQKQILKDFHILQKIWSHPQVLHNFQMKSRDKKDKIKAEKIEDDLAIADQEADIKPAETEVWWLQYLNGGSMLDSLDSSNKFVAVFRILHECVALGDKVLIFSTSLFCLDALEYFLKNINKWSLGQEYYRLDGSVPAEVRQKWCREFNADNNIKTKLFLISTRAGCLGLNMTAANRVIILDTSWNPAHDIQSIFRVYRFGQKKDCYIYRLVALGTMEQKIYERSVTKQAVACRVVDEQQIDRHYNLAELTELYSVDEMGLSVAGGVAVGIGDVALLRVARDAAIHAVHEHDSLLRGSGEQGLPEHERAAAWNQFQQEHEHKQMQNDISANNAKVKALKRLEMEHLRQQALYSSQNYIQTEHGPVKTEQPPETYPLLEPKEEPGQKPKGKKSKKSNIVQCRIPIATGPQPGPSTQPDDYDNQRDMVQKITTLLIKHNFMQNKSGHRQISELVAKVKSMVATGKPMALGPGYDELSTSIANVLLHREESLPPPPALTDIERPQPISKPEEIRKGGKKKLQPRPQTPEPPEPPPAETVPETDGRRRRKAAIAAEMQFDQQDIIDIDDDGDDWQNDDTEMIEDEPTEPEPPIIQKKTEKAKGKKAAEVDSSIVLSDDETVSEVTPVAAPVTNKEDNDVVALHPSLLTNSNFIKIVAHTYLAGNPMMDEDAATLAAQYSTLKTLKEAEAEGKPIDSGPVYDIAIQVLGKDVLRKLQAANPQSSGEASVAANKLQSLLGKSKEPEKPTPPAPVKKPKIGPKSRVTKEVKTEPVEPNITISKSQTDPQTIVIKSFRKGNEATSTLKPVTVSKNAAPSSLMFTPTPSTPHEESILPDDEEVTLSGPSQPAVDRKPIILRKVKLDRDSIAKLSAAMPVSMGRGPAPQAPPSNTICLDSDEEAGPPSPPPPRRQRTIVQIPTLVPSHQAPPVPVALTGPNSRPVPLPPPTPVPSSQPSYFVLSPCGTRAVPVSGPEPQLVSSQRQHQPVPISFTGPGGRQVLSLYPGTGRTMFVPASHASPAPQAFPGQAPVPISLTGPDSRPIPMSISGPGFQPGTMSYGAPASQPIPMSLMDSSGRPVAFADGRYHQQGNVGVRLASPATQEATPMQTSSSAAPLTHKLKSADAPPQILRSHTSGDLLNRKLGKASAAQAQEVVTHTIVDDEPAPAPIPEVPKMAKVAAAPAKPVATPAKPATTAAKPAATAAKPAATAAKPAATPAKPVVTPAKPVVTPAKPAATLAKEVATPPSSPPRNRRSSPRPRRRFISSSSSSSGRSRSSSPDPLAILKDVVHIQAPTLQNKTHITPQKTTSNTVKLPSKPSTSASKTYISTTRTISTGRKNENDSVDLTSVYIGSTKSNIIKNQYNDTMDLTKQTRPSISRKVKSDGKVREDATKTCGAFKIDYSKPANSNKTSTSKSTPSKLVGTSKSIILDGKSKSLKMENKTNISHTIVTNTKKQSDKRPAGPSTPVPASKKKKTDQMTLKDFDIDDIDDIIELD